MIDITHKITTLRTAVAQAIVEVGDPETIRKITNDEVPKGNVFEMAKTAGLFAVKKTSDIIPDCHPLPVESTTVDYEVEGNQIRILVEVKTIYRTGVEVEAMHGASVVALTMYDMLKPLDKKVEVSNIKLVNKKGGKSDYRDHYKKRLSSGIIVCSDTVAAGKKEDKSGQVIREKLEQHEVDAVNYVVVPDEIEAIRSALNTMVNQGLDLVLLTGGTGLSPRDVTPEAVEPLLHRKIPGIIEASRSYGQERMPYAMLSRGVSGVIDETIVITLPGSSNGAKESMDALIPHMLHLFRIFKGARHN